MGDATLKPRRVPANLRFAGRVPSTAAQLAAAQVAVAPLRHGSGTRLKLLEFFAAGLPVVCTAKAAEGLDVRDDRDVRFAETAAEFIAAIRALHADPATAAALGARRRGVSWNAPTTGRRTSPTCWRSTRATGRADRGDLSGSIKVGVSVSGSMAGTRTLRVKVVDASGKVGTASRAVTVSN